MDGERGRAVVTSALLVYMFTVFSNECLSMHTVEVLKDDDVEGPLAFTIFFSVAMSCTYVQSIPRTVLLDTKTGSNLLQWPVVEVENLRMSGKSYDGVALDRGSVVPLDVGKATQVNAARAQLAAGQLGATAPAANELARCPQPACWL
jgi:hypothetical protein